MAVLPSTTAVALMPALRVAHAPDALIGGFMGVMIGLSVVMLIAIRRERRCAQA